MVIFGLGIDIVEIVCIEVVIVCSGDCFVCWVLSDYEWSIWEQYQQLVCFLVKCFVVKEVVVKVLGIGICNGLVFNQFEVYNDELGKLKLWLWGEVNFLVECMGVSVIYVIFVDECYYVCVMVIVESQSGGWLNFICVVYQYEFILQLFFIFEVCWIFQDCIWDWVYFLVGWCVVMIYVFGVVVVVNFINVVIY